MLLRCLTYIVVVIFLIACGERKRQNEPIRKQVETRQLVDSLRQDVKLRYTAIEMNKDKIYSLLEKKLRNDPKELDKLLKMKKQVNAFKRYMDSLTKKYIIACGDPDGKSIPYKNKDEYAITDDFFFTKKQAARLPGIMEETWKSMPVEIIADPIRRKDFMKVWRVMGEKKDALEPFLYTPPRDVIGMLHSIAAGAGQMEAEMLNGYGEKYLKEQ